MDILTLELLDVTVFQALLELRALMDEHPGEALVIRGEDETLRINVAGYLEKQGRAVRLVRTGNPWELQVPTGARPRPVAAATPVGPALRPVLLLRSAFAPGDRALGRRLLLETLAQLDANTPWLCLAHQAVELLEDPLAVAALEILQEQGVAVRVSEASLVHAGLAPGAFQVVADATWQRPLGQGSLTVL